AAAKARELERSIDDEDWQACFDIVGDDLRAALAAAEGGKEAFALARTLGHLTYARRFLVEAHDHFAAAIRLAPDDRAAVDALRAAADAALAEFRGDAAFAHLTEASDRARRAGDLATAAIALADAAMVAGRAPATFDRRLTIGELEVLIDKVRVLVPPEDQEVAAHLTMAVTFASNP